MINDSCLALRGTLRGVLASPQAVTESLPASRRNLKWPALNQFAVESNPWSMVMTPSTRGVNPVTMAGNPLSKEVTLQTREVNPLVRRGMLQVLTVPLTGCRG